MHVRPLAGSAGLAGFSTVRLVVAGLVVCLLASACARRATRGQAIETAAARSSSAPVTSADAACTIPFRLVDDQIVVLVTINGRIRVEMVLDTGFGSEGALLLDPELGRQLGLEYAQRVDLGGGGRGAPSTAHVAVGATLQLSGVTFPNQPLLVLDDGSKYAQWSVKGIIGRTVMTRPVEIDYEGKVLNILSAVPNPPERSGEPLSLTFVQGIPVARAVVVREGGKEVPVELLVDTGASDALLLRPVSHPRLGVPTRVIASSSGVMGEGLAGSMKGFVGRVEELRLGGFTLDNVVAIFLDETTMGTASPLVGNGLLGSEVLQRFTVLFDYAGERMFLRPNASFGRRFDFDMAGLVMQARGDGSFTVLDVIQDSTAARAGLTGGDVLVAIDGKDVRALTSEVVFSKLREQGRQVEVTVERGGARLTRTVTLERLI